MDTNHPLSALSPTAQAALVDAAKRRAVELRAAAIAEVWSVVGRRLRAVSISLRRMPALSSTTGRP